MATRQTSETATSERAGITGPTIERPEEPDVIYLVTSSTYVLGRPAGASITAAELRASGCSIPALIAAGHLKDKE